MYHNGKLNECMYVAVTTSLLYMRAGLGTNVMVMSVCNSSVVRKKNLHSLDSIRRSLK